MPSLLKMMAEMGLNIAPFQSGMKQAQSAADKGFASMGSHLKQMVAGYFGWQALKTAVIGVAKEMANLKDQSDQLVITTDEVQKLGIAADAVGLSLEDMAAALMKFNKARAEGAFPGAKGSDLDLIRKLDLEHITDQQMRDLFGKTGSRMRAALRELQTGGEGALITERDIQLVDEAEAALKRLGREWKAVVAAPAIGAASKALVGHMEEMKKTGQELGEELGEALGETGLLGKLKALTKFGIGKAMVELGFDEGRFSRVGKGRFAGLEKVKGNMGDGVTLPVDAQTMKQVEKLREQIEQKMSDAAFGRADKTGKIAIMQKQIKDANSEMLKIHEDLTRAIITQEEAERRLLEQKLRQVEAEEKLVDLKKQGGVGFEAFRRMAQAGGLNPQTFINGEAVTALKNIDRGLNAGQKLIIGGR